MKHFHTHWAEIFQIPWNYEIISLTKSNSLLRNLILAITAAHLRHVSPGALQHRIAEHFLQSLPLKDYKRALDMPIEELGQSDVDIVLLSAMLLNILSFALSESETVLNGSGQPEPSLSWVFSPRPDRLGWLALQAGFRPLIKSMAIYLEKTMSFLVPLFLGAEQETWEFLRMDRGLESVPKLWINFFDLSDDGYGCECNEASSVKTFDGRQNLANHIGFGENFRAPVAILAQLRRLEPVYANLFRNFQFLGKMHGEFQKLLYEREEKALWLFGYWLGLMCRFEGIWWCDLGARRDYKAILIWLKQLHLPQRPGIEGEMWSRMLEELELAQTF